MLVEHRSFDFGMETQQVPETGDHRFCKIHGRLVYVFAQDFHCVWWLTIWNPCHKICVNHGPGHGKRGSSYWPQRFRWCQDSGRRILWEDAGYFIEIPLVQVIPQISAIMGPCAGGAVYSPAITDFIMMVENTSYMFVTGPNGQDGNQWRCNVRRIGRCYDPC